MNNISLQSTLAVIDTDLDKLLEEAFNELEINSLKISDQQTKPQTGPDVTCNQYAPIPQYQSLIDLINAKPKELEDQMIPLLSSLAKSTYIPIPYFQSSMGMQVDTVPIIEDIIDKHGFEVATGFGRLAMQNIFQKTSLSGKNLTSSQIYDVYNRLLSIPSLFSESEILKIKETNFSTANDLEKDDIDFNTLSDHELIRILIICSVKTFIPSLINKTPSKIIACLI